MRAHASHCVGVALICEHAVGSRAHKIEGSAHGMSAHDMDMSVHEVDFRTRDMDLRTRGLERIWLRVGWNSLPTKPN